MKKLNMISKDILFILVSFLLIGVSTYMGVSFISPSSCSVGHGTVLPATQVYILMFLINTIYGSLYFLLRHKFPKRYLIYIVLPLLTYSCVLYQLSIYCF